MKQQDKGVKTAFGWFFKTNAVGLLIILLGMFLLVILALFLVPIFPNPAIGFLISLGISLFLIIVGLYHLNKRLVPEWKSKSTPESRKLAKIFTICFLILLIFVYTATFMFPSLLNNEILKTILQIPFFIIFILYAYYRFAKKKS